MPEKMDGTFKVGDRKYCIYLITNMVNGKQYAGKTKVGIKQRWSEHCWYSTRGKTALASAIRKYGEESFSKVILREGLTKLQADEEEKLTIRTLCLMDKSFGYNMTEGGDGCEQTPEIIQKVCETKGWHKDPLCGGKHFILPLPTEEIVRKFKSGTTKTALAEEYGCNIATIAKRLKESGAGINPIPQESLLNQYARGLSVKQLCVEFGRTESTIRRRLKDAGLCLKDIKATRDREEAQRKASEKTPRKSNKGTKRSEETKQKMRENNAQRRWDVEDTEVLRLYEDGLSSLQIAKKFGMTHPAIQRRLRLNGVQLRSVGARANG